MGLAGGPTGKVDTMTEDRQPRTRSAVQVGAALLMAVALMAAVAACGSDGGSTATEGSTPATTGSDTTAGEQPIGPAMTTAWSGVRTDGDGLVIVFLGNPAVSDPPGGCQSDYQALATETDQAVTVTVHGTHPEECPNQIQYGRTVRVALDAPLGSREVRNGANDDPEVVFDGSRLLRPTWLPDGWEQTGDRPSEAGTGQPVAAWQLSWGPPLSQGTSCGGQVGSIDLTVGGPDLLQEPWVTSFVAVAPTTVRGHPAEQARYTPAENPNASSRDHDPVVGRGSGLCAAQRHRLPVDRPTGVVRRAATAGRRPRVAGSTGSSSGPEGRVHDLRARRRCGWRSRPATR